MPFLRTFKYLNSTDDAYLRDIDCICLTVLKMIYLFKDFVRNPQYFLLGQP